MTCNKICEKHRMILTSWFKLDLFQMWAFVARRRPELFFWKSCSLWIMCAVIYRSFGKAAYLNFFWNWSTRALPQYRRGNNKVKTGRKRYPLSSSARIPTLLIWIQYVTDEPSFFNFLSNSPHFIYVICVNFKLLNIKLSPT